jgi:protein-disulfide isomerase
MSLTRRLALTFAAGAAIALAACDRGGASSVAEGEMTLGRADAPVTVIEYASVTCGHCAVWNEEVFPAFKKKYIDTGQVRYVMREILTPPYPVASAGFLLARCAGKDRYFSVVDSLFRGQQQLVQGVPPREMLLGVARSAGMSEAQFNACVADEKQLEALNDRVEKWTREEQIEGTPTFQIGDTKLVGPRPLEELDAAIQPLLRKRQGG